MRVLVLLSLLFGCTHRRETFRPESWGIQLQGYEKNDSFEKIRASKKDLWVVDPDSFSSFQVRALKANGKKVIGYLSLGEAEAYRGYYKDLPKDLILGENPNWKDNFTVKFWEPRWEETLKRELVTILALGFDGVFLDVIDAFDRFPDKKTKAEAMARLVEKLSGFARKKDPDFIIILQNGIHIRRYLEAPEKILGAISGVNAESVFKERSTSLEEDLRFYRDARKFILGLEYLTDPQEREAYEKFAQENKILPLLQDKALNGTETAY